MTNSKRISRASKRRLALFGTISILVIFYFIFSVFYSSYRIHKLKQEEKSLTNKLNELHKEEKILSNDIEKLQDPEYLAKYAREAFSYSKEDEIIIQKYKDEKKEEKVEEKFTFSDIFDNSYIILIGSIVFGIIFLYIVIKIIKHRKKKKQKKKRKNWYFVSFYLF